MERIQIDTARLGATSGDIRERIAKMRSCVQRLYAEAAELNTMWEGPANQAFQRQFSQDQESMTQICAALENYVQDLHTAKTEYEACDSDVGGIIDAIRI